MREAILIYGSFVAALKNCLEGTRYNSFCVACWIGSWIDDPTTYTSQGKQQFSHSAQEGEYLKLWERDDGASDAERGHSVAEQRQRPQVQAWVNILV